MKNNKRKINLLEGNILQKLILLSAPLMATAFINIVYGMTDTAWLGRLGNSAVAATGAAHFFVWIAVSLGLIAKIGTSIYTAQEYGSRDYEKLLNTIKNGIMLLILIIGTYTLIINIFSVQIISFFNLEPHVQEYSLIYLRIISFGFMFAIMNILLSSIYNSLGNSFFPFIANVIGLIMNIIIDPIFIFGFGPIPALGVAGAAYASILSQTIVFLIIITDSIISKNEIYEAILKGKISLINMKEKFEKGIPVGLMSIFHAVVSMTLAKFTAWYGTIPIAVFAVGSQLESVTWMTSEGFSGGIVAFVGQNYGAKQYKRLKEIIKKSVFSVMCIGILGTFILISFRHSLFDLFVPNEPETNIVGAKYLLILGISQLLMALEIGISGIFNGLGKTKIPAFVSTIFNVLRIPGALILMNYFDFYGIWIAISLSSIIKGLIMIYYMIIEYRYIEYTYPNNNMKLIEQKE